MRILIITIPRSGSVSLLLGLSETLKLKKVGEPFNKHLWSKQPNIDLDDTIVKTFIDQVPSNIKNPIEFYAELSKKFDKTILVTRENVLEAAQSYAYHSKHSTTTGWVNKYYFDDTDLEVESTYKWYVENINNLKKLSQKLKIEIDTYENIFSGDSDKINQFIDKHKLELNYNKLLEYLNPKNKYRQSTPIII